MILSKIPVIRSQTNGLRNLNFVPYYAMWIRKVKA